MATTNLGKVSVTPKGEYDPLITYERLDVISHNGSSYIVKQASTGVTPIEGEFYALIAEKGDGGSFVKKAYKTYAAMDADKVNIPANSSVDVTNDPDESKNGAYIYDGVAFTRSQYDSKVVTDKIIADTAIAVQDAINNTVISSGFVTIDSFELGATLTQRNQALRHAVDGKLYRWAGDLPKTVAIGSTPANSGGVAANAWLEVSDVTLRQDLANPDNGALMVRGAVIYVNTIADLQALDTSRLVDGATAELSGFYSAGDGGGGPRRIYKSGATSGTYVHDGVSVIVPEGSDGSSAWLWEYTGTIDARWFGVDASGDTNTTTALTNYLQYMQNSQNVGSCSGTFLVTAPFLINMNNGRYLWDATFVTDNVSEIGLEIRAARADMFGKIRVVCGDRVNDSSEADYYARRQDIGVYLTGVERSRIGRIETRGTKRTGILIDHIGANSNMFYVDHCQTYYAGSGTIFKGNAVSVENTGGADSVAQRCMVTTQDDIPTTLAAEDYCAINGQLFVVADVDFDNKTLVLYPQANQESVGEISYFIGEGVKVIGNDANVGHIRLIDAVRVGTSAKLQSLFGTKVDVIHSNVRGVGVSVGTISSGTAGGVSRGGSIGYLYNEYNTFSLVELGLNVNNWSVITSNALDIDYVKIQPRNSLYQRSISTQRLSEDSTPQIKGLDLTDDPTERRKTSLRTNIMSTGYLLIGKEDDPDTHKWGVIYGARAGGSAGRNSTILQFSMVTYTSSANPLEPAFYFEDNSFGSERVIPKKVEYDGDIWYALHFSTNTGRSGARFVVGSDDFKTVAPADVTEIGNLTGNYSKYLNETLRFLPNGEIRPLVDGSPSLGSSGGRWDQLYAVNGTINTSDEREKQQVSNLSDAEVAVSEQLKGMIRKFKWNHAVALKGDDARWHFGVMAQEVKQAFDEHGLDAHDYGLFCYDEWYEGPELIDEETGEVIEQEPNRDRYGVRYEQLLAFIISAM